jgi:hypothetical protein
MLPGAKGTAPIARLSKKTKSYLSVERREVVMGDEARSRSQLLRELRSLRDQMSTLERRGAALEQSLGLASSEGLLPEDFFYELPQVPAPMKVGFESTESIDLKSIFTRDVTASGSFDLTGGIWATTFGKIIQALPIPAFLVEESLKVAVSNQACARFTPRYEVIQGRPFRTLAGGPFAAERAQSVLQRVFSDRTPRICEGILKIDQATVWARMTFRAIRVMRERFVLVLVEDLTREKVQLRENEMLRKELEKRVARRTAELQSTNTALKSEVVERKRAEQEKEKVIVQLRRALAEVKKLSGLLPICASCKKIRDDKGYWQQIEAYIRDHSEAEFSHGICPECAKKLYPDIFDHETSA